VLGNELKKEAKIRLLRWLCVKKDKELLFQGFFKENVRYPIWTCRDPISLILGTRFSILGTWIGSLKHLKKPWSYYRKIYCFVPLFRTFYLSVFLYFQMSSVCVVPACETGPFRTFRWQACCCRQRAIVRRDAARQWVLWIPGVLRTRAFLHSSLCSWRQSLGEAGKSDRYLWPAHWQELQEQSKDIYSLSKWRKTRHT